MIVGVPKEVKVEEHRVSLIPGGAKALAAAGHRVLVQAGAGADIGYHDADYADAGAEIVPEASAVWEQADLIVKVKEPQPAETAMLRPGQLLFTYLHLAANRELTDALIASGATAIAYETISVKGRLPLLEPMSEIAGRMSVIMGGHHLSCHKGGKGILLGGVPGVLPGKVVVIGGGTAGVNAARMAEGLGADVTILEVDLERMRFLDITMPGTHTLFSNEDHLDGLLPTCDLLIGAVLVPGSRAPKLIRRGMLRHMKPGSVLVDIAIDQGGCAETSRPTTHQDPTYVEEGVIHYCVANMPGAYARTATQALTNVTQPYVLALAEQGLEGAMAKRPELEGGINVREKKVCCAQVAEAHGLSGT